MYYDRFKTLCSETGEKPTTALLKLGLSSGNIHKWLNGSTVNSAILCKVADYFNVSVDYLLERTDNPKVNE